MRETERDRGEGERWREREKEREPQSQVNIQPSPNPESGRPCSQKQGSPALTLLLTSAAYFPAEFLFEMNWGVKAASEGPKALTVSLCRSPPTEEAPFGRGGSGVRGGVSLTRSSVGPSLRAGQAPK